MTIMITMNKNEKILKLIDLYYDISIINLDKMV